MLNLHQATPTQLRYVFQTGAGRDQMRRAALRSPRLAAFLKLSGFGKLVPVPQ